MCGIGGILRTDGKRIPETWLQVIDGRIAHRGPDDAGTFRDEVEFEEDGQAHHTTVALVHRRLSIIDHAGGRQPMIWKAAPAGSKGAGRRVRSKERAAASEDRNAASEDRIGTVEARAPAHTDDRLVAVVFNGCIYNHRALRRELESAGHGFTSDHSDTEVLVHGWREWGEALTDHLEGMYALAIWDRSAHRLFLARDWFGEKPLYVRHSIGGNPAVTAFASDAQCLAQLGSAALSPGDGLSLAVCGAWLRFGHVRGERTLYATAGRSDGGGEITDDDVRLHAPAIRARIDELRSAAPAPLAPEELERLLEHAVARRLEADVPLGCFLSGGVDSSLVALYAKRHRPELRTFSVRMPDPHFDESEHAGTVAAHLDTDHTTLDIAAHPADDLVHLISVLGQPFADSSILPTYWISRAARAHVTVALTGDGGDELFLGYDRYLAARPLARAHRWLRYLPRALLRGAAPRSRRMRLGRLGEMARDFPALGALSLEALFTDAQLEALLGGPPGAIEDPPSPDADPLEAIRRDDLLHYLPNDLLVKVDIASMSVGLEVRAPFLDRDLVRAALAAPLEDLLAGGSRKGLLRVVARRLLPASVVDRPKMGFAIPIGRWFRNDFGSMRALLLDSLRTSAPFGPIPLKRQAVKRFVDEHLSGTFDHSHRLFALLTLSLWARGS